MKTERNNHSSNIVNTTIKKMKSYRVIFRKYGKYISQTNFPIQKTNEKNKEHHEVDNQNIKKENESVSIQEKSEKNINKNQLTNSIIYKKRKIPSYKNFKINKCSEEDKKRVYQTLEDTEKKPKKERNKRNEENEEENSDTKSENEEQEKISEDEKEDDKDKENKTKKKSKKNKTIEERNQNNTSDFSYNEIIKSI